MIKYKYTEEYELSSSPRIIFTYLQNPASLAEWFAEKVTLDNDKVFNFIWDKTNHYAKIVTIRQNKHIKFEFLDNEKQNIEDAPYIEFKIQQSELTNSSYLKITDYSEMTEPKDLEALWSGLMAQLRQTMGETGI